MTARLTPNDLVAWRRALRDDRDGEFDTTLAHQLVARLMAELEMLWAERDRSRAELLTQIAATLEVRLKDLGRRGPPNAPGYGCVHCRDSEARSFITYLRAMAATPKQRG
ncbi:MAG: hypothetical protein ACJ79E_00745 [Anaeromyxobacteraceae bacterium]